ncbi:MAG: CPXCG motif-containing cysteine-rich protein [Gammaproteobacteria bacterium]
MLILKTISCPYCGENFETQIDCSVESQHYIEDCYVCCSPIIFSVTADCNGNLIDVIITQDNE